MKARRRTALWAVTAVVLTLIAWKLHTSHFAWGMFWSACRSVDPRYLLLGTLTIYVNPVFRAARWAIFLRPSQPPGQRSPWVTLIGPQFVGFAGLAALGRVGELIRPYLISRRTGLSFASQIAVVAVERIFDLAAFGLLFAGNLALSRGLGTLPYHERYPLFGYAIAGAIAFLCLFVLSLRLAGETVARVARVAISKFSRRGGDLAAEKILEFRSGLNTVGSTGDFAAISILSLAIWISIAFSYVLVLRAFPAPVHNLTVSHTLLLMGFSVAGGIVQLPGIGGGAQVLTITALTVLFGVPKELATSAGIILWVVSTMSVILPGLIFARAEHVSLRGVAKESGRQPVPHPVH